MILSYTGRVYELNLPIPLHQNRYVSFFLNLVNYAVKHHSIKITFISITYTNNLLFPSLYNLYNNNIKTNIDI